MTKAVAAARLLVMTAVRAAPARATAVLVLAPLLGVMSAGQALGLQWMVDGALRDGPSPLIRGAVVLAVVTVVIHQVSAIGSDLRNGLQHRVGLEFDRNLMRFFAGRAHLDHFHDPAFLDTAAVLRQRRAELGTAFAAVVENVNVFARFAGATILLATANPLLALLPVGVLPLVGAVRLQERLVSRAEMAGAEADRRRRDLFQLACDPAAAREVRVYRLGAEIARRHREAATTVIALREKARLRGTAVVAAGWAVFVVALTAGLYVTVHAVRTGTASPGQAALVVVLSTRLSAATSGLAQLVAWLRRALNTAGLYLTVMAEPVPAAAPPQALPRGPAEIVLDRVSFSYPGSASPVLDDVSLRLPAGATVALVGTNGAGKSTLVALLAGLYRPTSGRILVGGVDLAAVPAESWRSRVTACLQDFFRYQLTLREAVGLGDVTAGPDDDAAVRRALELSGATGIADALPDGLDTQLGRTFPGGTDLSSGQWQRVALARARMRPGADLVLLDEPAAGLDPETEAAVLQRYVSGARSHPGTTVIVSHRMATVRDADLIVVLHEGRVAESGTHQELLAAGGPYAEMHALQAAPYSPSYG
ncbi:ABC transporter ATP-binding protein [Actinoplanes sp. NPDC023801]|uniref:ABC transporter ATP-binding protein n=1 Tax=Actinoplanes sp. NPDC023801 TaxID=3154595 RepID=UPI0033F86FCE